MEEMQPWKKKKYIYINLSVKNRNKKFNFSDSWNEIYVIALSAIEENYKSVTCFIKFFIAKWMLKARKENNISSGFRIKNALYNKE